MKETKNILDNEKLKENPFSLPEEYIRTLEANVHSIINNKEGEKEKKYKPLLSYLALAMSFALVLGLGYGIIPIATKYLDRSTSNNDPLLSLIDEGYISSNFIENYYDDIVITDSTTSDIETLQRQNITSEEIMYYLEENITE